MFPFKDNRYFFDDTVTIHVLSGVDVVIFCRDFPKADTFEDI